MHAHTSKPTFTNPLLTKSFVLLQSPISTQSKLIDGTSRCPDAVSYTHLDVYKRQMQTVRDCFKLDVERYVLVNFNVVSKAIDKIGGVDIELTQAEAEHLNSAKKNYYESGSDIQRCV